MTRLVVVPGSTAGANAAFSRVRQIGRVRRTVEAGPAHSYFSADRSRNTHDSHSSFAAVVKSATRGSACKANEDHTRTHPSQILECSRDALFVCAGEEEEIMHVSGCLKTGLLAQTIIAGSISQRSASSEV